MVGKCNDPPEAAFVILPRIIDVNSAADFRSFYFSTYQMDAICHL